MRASWDGFITLAQLSIPVKLYTAVKTVTPHFTRLHKPDLSPTKRVITCIKEDKEIGYDETVRAAKAPNGKYVEVSDAEIDTTIQGIKNITIKQFTDPIEVDASYFEKTYYVTPGPGGELAYTLFREAFDRANKIAVATFMLHEKEHIGIIRAKGGVLMLEQLRFADEIVPRSDIKTKTLPQPTPDQVDLAIKLMQRYSSPFYIEDYRNEQVDVLTELIDRKAKGLPPKRTPKVAAEATPEHAIEATLKTLATGPIPNKIPPKQSKK